MMPFICHLENRAILEIRGKDCRSFLQGLITQDVNSLPVSGMRYGCLLTPQGKFLHDFMIIAPDETCVWLTPERNRATALLQKLSLYKLRAAVQLTIREDIALIASTAPLTCPVLASAPDPRDPRLGIISILHTTQLSQLSLLDSTAYSYHRTLLAVPDGSHDLPIEQAILLENRMDALHAIDWEKGCYMGQELTARTKYRGLVRKTLVCVNIPAQAPAFDAPLFDEDGKEQGKMRSHICYNDICVGLALIRLENNSQQLHDEAGNQVTL